MSMPVSPLMMIDAALLAFEENAKRAEKLTKKEKKIKRLWENGTRDCTILAKRLGYAGSSLTAGVEKAREMIIRLKLH